MVAFPGAEGFGANSVGGQGGRDLEVTNLNDDGDGSLRMALRQNYPRSIHFRVSGDIWNQTPLSVNNPYFTLEGISAPGPITLRGEEFGVRTHDGIVRHIRVRTGTEIPPKYGWDNRDAVKVGNPDDLGGVYNLYFDHCDLMWSVDELLSHDNGARDTTYSHCLFAEALNNSKHPEGPHSMGPLFRGNAGNVSLIKSVMACNMGRNPQIVYTSLFDMYNCLIFNYGKAGTELKGPKLKGNIRNCVWKKGLDTVGPAVQVTDDAAPDVELFFDGNVSDEYPDPATSWDMIKTFKGKTIPQTNRRTTPFSTPTGNILATSSVMMYLLWNVGAKLPYRDAVDIRILQGILNGTGRIVDTPP